MTSDPVSGPTLSETAAQRKRAFAQKQALRLEVAGAVARRGVHSKRWHFEPQFTEPTENWLITYLDVITLLLVLLLVMLTMAGDGAGEQREADHHPVDGVLSLHASNPLSGGSVIPVPGANKVERVQDLTQGLNLDNLGDDVDIILNEKSVSFRINSEILFGSGEARLSVGGLEVLQRLAHSVKNSPHTVTIEGHTDSIPIRSTRFPSNWELSSARAGSVVRYLEANGIASQRLRAIGYADTRPLADNDTSAHRALNRRVELLLELPATLAEPKP
ncbi:MAG TPA: OmpA family protein [Pusillimonas sp.]|uniref:OmpA/MotB family protein n=1 Tax=Pusillimonas sp. TaxID=3040095 RepID=UPI002BC48A3E|nr:OmpA family protein [Pusillimonas sp.]HUH88032.1 OmpA family protein [Pusillimonas sp.]